MKPTNRDNEVDICKRLESLRRVCVPSFIAFGTVGFSRALILEYFNVFVPRNVANYRLLACRWKMNLLP